MSCNVIGIAFTLAPSSVEFKISDTECVCSLMYNKLNWNVKIVCFFYIVFTGAGSTNFNVSLNTGNSH